MRRYKIIKEETPNGDHVYTIWWHSPFLWMKDRWTPESYYTDFKIRKIMKFVTLYEAQFYINDRYADRTKTVAAEGVV